MPKQTVTIEVDVPEGKEIAAHAVSGAQYSGTETQAVLYTIAFRPAWRWPDWLKAPWIAMDENGIWYCFEEEPHIDNTLRPCGLGEWLQKGLWWRLLPTLCDFTPPPCTDWRQSKRRRPQ